jgi:hypothetical protein
MIEVRQVILARSLQMLKSSSGTVGYLPDLVAQLKARYSFIKAPEDEELLPSDPPKGAEFRHGKLPDNSNVIIDRFTVFSDGVVADAAESTDDADNFLTDLAEWAKKAIPKAIPSGPRFYLSQLEITMSPSIASYVPRFNPLGQSITDKLASYGIQSRTYEPSTVSLHFDVLGKAAPQPGAFFIDRRINIPYSESVWFAQAPLKTKDHVALLRELERSP